MSLSSCLTGGWRGPQAGPAIRWRLLVAAVAAPPYLDVALGVDLRDFPADGVRDVLRLLHRPLADANLFAHHGLLVHGDPLFAHGHADVFTFGDRSVAGMPRHGMALDDDLL